jgi:hypothetical protein
MARKFKLDDLHLILLLTATQREDGGILPVSETIANQQDRIAKALPELQVEKEPEKSAIPLQSTALQLPNGVNNPPKRAPLREAIVS